MLRLYGQEKTATILQKPEHSINININMVPKAQGVMDRTITGMKHLSIWDEGESSSPLMDRTNASLSSSDHSSSSFVPVTPKIHSPRKIAGVRKQTGPSSFMEYELKNARDALVGSISAVINFLSSSGVPKPTCDQLHKNLDMGRYFAVMKRAQDYIQCLPSREEDEILAKIHLSVIAWESLCRFKAIEYKRAYKHSFHLRHEIGGTPLEIQTAINVQVQIAEQCTTCQKKLYLVQKWQRYLLKKLKRTTLMEPEGYQPIRCI